MQNVELVIFDMDGLILDTESLYLKYGLEIFNDLGYEITEKIFLGTVGLNDESTNAYYSEFFGRNFNYKSISKKIDERLLETSRNKMIEVKKGFFELIDYLEKNNVKRVVATSSDRKKAEFMLKNADLINKFDFLICGDEVTNGKPDPEIFLKAAEKLNVEPKNTMVLEDSYNGLRAAKSAGMIPVMIPDLLEINNEIEKIIYKSVHNLENVVEILTLKQSLDFL